MPMRSRSAEGPKPAQVESRYDLHKIARTIERLRTSKKLSMEAFALSVGLARKQDYEKRRGSRGATWEVEDIGRVANAYGMHPGWPFITREELRALIAAEREGGDL